MKVRNILFLMLLLSSCKEGTEIGKDINAKVGTTSTPSSAIKIVSFDSGVMIQSDGFYTSFKESSFNAELARIIDPRGLQTLPLVAAFNFDQKKLEIYHLENNYSFTAKEGVAEVEFFGEYGGHLFTWVEDIEGKFFIIKTDGTRTGTSSLQVPRDHIIDPFIKGHLAYYLNTAGELIEINLSKTPVTHKVKAAGPFAKENFHPFIDVATQRSAIIANTHFFDLTSGVTSSFPENVRKVIAVRYEYGVWKVAYVSDATTDEVIAGPNLAPVTLANSFHGFIRGGHCLRVWGVIECTDNSTQGEFTFPGNDLDIYEILGTQYLCNQKNMCAIRYPASATHLFIATNFPRPLDLPYQIVAKGGRNLFVNSYDDMLLIEKPTEVIEFTGGASYHILESLIPIQAVNKYFQTRSGTSLYVVQQLGVAE